jgi:hypothetical protein
MTSKCSVHVIAIGVAALFCFVQTASACVCVAPRNPRPPRAADVRAYVTNLFNTYRNVVRVRAIEAVPRDPPRRSGDVIGIVGAAVFKFEVIESWKGDYKVGDRLIARSVGIMSCQSEVRVGDEVLEGFDSIETADFTTSACPELFPKTLRKLENRYLRNQTKRADLKRSSVLVPPQCPMVTITVDIQQSSDTEHTQWTPI